MIFNRYYAGKVFLVLLALYSYQLLSITVSSPLTNEYFIEKGANAHIEIRNEKNEACFVSIYTEDDESTTESWYYALPDTILIDAKSNFSYEIKTDIPDNIADKSYLLKVYVEEINLQNRQKTQFGSVETAVRYGINNIYHKNYNPSLSLDLSDFEIEDDIVNFSIYNSDKYLLSGEIEIQLINHHGEIVSKTKNKITVLNNSLKNISTKIDNKDKLANLKKSLVLISNNENDICVFEVDI